MDYQPGNKFGQGGKRPGAGRKSNQVVADRKMAEALFEARVSKSFGKLLDTAEIVSRGLKRKKFNHKGEPVIDPETGKQYFEIEYDTKMVCFLIERFVPAARQGIDISASGSMEEFLLAIADSKRYEMEQEKPRDVTSEPTEPELIQ